MPEIFDGAYNCTLKGKAGGSTVNFGSTGALDIACLSSYPMYLNKGNRCFEGCCAGIIGFWGLWMDVKISESVDVSRTGKTMRVGICLSGRI